MPLQDKGIVAARVVGMWVGIDIDPELATGRELCEALMSRGVLAKDTHGSTIRLSPPLTTSDADLEWAMDRLGEALDDLVRLRSRLWVSRSRLTSRAAPDARHGASRPGPRLGALDLGGVFT